MKGMVREATRVVESAITARLTKGSSGDGWDRRTWEPGAGGWRPGGSDSTWM